jgi:NADH-dependant formate dehydrogenase delta subunit FdsD
MHAEYLVRMVSDIESFFSASNDPKQAAVEIAGHIDRLWDPRMRRGIVEVWRAGKSELSATGQAAIAIVAEHLGASH